MAKLFNDDVRTQITEILAQTKNPIQLVLFTKEGVCPTCQETQQLLEEVCETNEKLTLSVKSIETDKALADTYGVTMTPSFVILDSKGVYKGVKFNGIPAGHEINSLISALLEMSGLTIHYQEQVLNRINSIEKPINIKVFVTLSCPHCAGAVQNAHRLAMLNPNIEAEMIEAQTFQELSTKHNVSGVPKIVINDQHELVGNQPIEAFLEKIERI